MGEINPESKAGYKHESVKKKGKGRPVETHYFNKKTVLLILVVIIVLLISSFILFRPPSPKYNDISNTTLAPLTESNSFDNPAHKTVHGKTIATEPTESVTAPKRYRERIEIPGDIADKLENKAHPPAPTDGASYNTRMAKLQRKTTRTYVSSKEESKPNLKITETKSKTKKLLKYNEFPLRETIENDHYTIQLSGSTTKKCLLNFIKEHKVTNYQIYQTSRKKDVWYVIIKGNYPTLSDAKLALNALPDKWKIDKPWIRKGKSVRRDKR